MRVELGLYECEHGKREVHLDFGDGVGVRLAVLKPRCCKRMQRVTSWPLSADEVREIVNELECTLDRMEDGEQ